MIRYEGNGQVTVDLASGEILKLSEDELSELCLLTKSYFMIDDEEPEILRSHKEILRSYNKKEKIISLFNRYKSTEKTKSDVFREISTELNISYKAVEKAYYTK